MKTSRNMSNLEIAKLLRSVAAALTLSKGDNRFRIIAYERAADAIEHSSSEVKDLWDDGNLNELAGVGTGIASSLDELFRTGQVKHYQKALNRFPEAIYELMEIPGIGPKSALKLSKSLGITNAHSAISDLEKAAKKGRIREIEDFGKDSEQKIIQSITELKGRTKRLLLPVAQENADLVIDWMRKNPNVKRIDTLGSLRRQVSTVGDIDIAVATSKPQEVIEHFKNYPRKNRILEAGTHTASLILPNEYQLDLMVQPEASYGSLLQHFTGSKHHNVALREFAMKKGLSLSEYGIKQGRKIHTFSSEEDFYNFLGLDWIPPEIREDKGEIVAARNHTLPNLVKLENIKGDLQIHSNINVEPSHDLGNSSVAELVEEALRLHYEYIGLTEHNPSVSQHTPSQVIDIIKMKTEIIQNINHENIHEKRGIYVFNGLEIDIQPDGKRALSDSALDLLDYACVSIHSSFRQNRKTMTDRVLQALDHPKIRFFAHPTGRLLNEREGVELDWDRIFDFCLKKQIWLEIDAWPNRLDLPDALVKDAVIRGVKIIINSDSHSADHLKFMRYGVSVARRGWATPSDIINTLSLTQISKLIKGGD